MTILLDNGLRLPLLAASNPGRLITIEEASTTFEALHAHVAKAANRLVRSAFLESLRGRNGGLRLARSPEQICLGEVVAAMTHSTCDNLFENDVLRGWRCVRAGARAACMRHLQERSLADLLGDPVFSLESKVTELQAL